MIDKKELSAYAELVIHSGVSLRPGQCLLVNTGVGTYDFAQSLAEAAYRAGAKFVRINVVDKNLTRYRIEHGSDLEWLPAYVVNESYEYLANDWARIRIDSTEELEVLKGMDPGKVAKVEGAVRGALRRQQEELMRDRHAWCVVAAPGPQWARHVFGHGDDPSLEDRLWTQLKKILRLDKGDPIAAWKAHAEALAKRCRTLDSFKLESLHFEGPDTDLFVYLNPTSIWKGGGSTLPDGRPFLPNIPTEEVFTTPDYRRTHGRVRVSRSLNVMETMVREAWFVFENGRVVDCGASQGADTLKKFVAMDEGAASLGEIALVAADSPIFQSGLFFGSILYDENASCHMALGAGYPSCFSDAERLSSPDLVRAAGCNLSMVHTDFMIGSPNTDVSGISGKRQIPIISQGSFVI